MVGVTKRLSLVPAAKPSQPAVANVVGALIAAGLRVASVHVNADGSFCVSVAEATSDRAEEFAMTDAVRDDEAPSWDDIDK